jgi:hypothetical protein
MLGFVRNAGIIEDEMWSLLISPYLTFSVVSQLKVIHQYPLNSIPWFVPPNEPHYIFSAGIVSASIVAIVAAFGMGRSLRIAYYVWTCLIVLSLVLLSGYILLCVFGWGLLRIAPQLAWESSFVIAFLFAVKNVEWRPIGRSSDEGR